MIYRTAALGAVMAAGALPLSAPVFAQSSGADQVEEIIVFGTARNRVESISQKRDADRIIEALGTDELGQLPDKNVGEALNRAPGVSMLVEKGEGRYVQIRGVRPELNNVTLNGTALGSPEAEGGGRVTPFDVLSSSLLRAVQVIKTPTPDMDGQGIGGTVNVETRMPFDNPAQLYGYATARMGYEEIRPRDESFGGEDPMGIDGLLSGKNESGTIGWLLGGTYSSREYVAQGLFQDDWRDVGGASLPEEVKNNYYLIGRDRINVSAALEYRPDEFASYFLRSFYANWDEFQHRNRFQQSLTGNIVAQTPDSGSADGNRVSANIRLEEVEKTLLSLTAGGENLIGERLLLEYEAQFNQNEIAEPYSFWEFRSGGDFGPDNWSTGGNGVVTVTPDAAGPDRQNPDLIDFRRVRFQDRDLSEDTIIAGADLTWDFADAYIKTGVKASRTERENDYTRSRFDGGADDLTLGSDPGFTSGGFVNDTPAGNAPNIWMNVDAMNRFFADPANAGFFELNEGDTFASDFSGDYDITESIYAAYVMAAREFGALSITGGVRVELTDVDSSGFLRNAGEAERVGASGDYTSVLPSLIANWRLSPEFVLRGAVTRALGRPNYDDVAPRANYVEEAGEGRLSIGNPALEARHSWNLDLSAEWYPNELTQLSLAVFYKDIDNEFVSRTERLVGQADIDGAVAALGLAGGIDTSVLDELIVSRVENGEASELLGAEVSAQTQFDMLPAPFDGFGAAASVTIIDAEVDIERDGLIETLPLPGQAESTYNLSLFYQKGPIDAALSYAYNDSFLTDINGSREEDLDQGEFGRWDARISYSFSENIRVFFEGVNLNDEPTSEFQGGRERQNTEFEYVGRSYYLGASFGF
ncbi:MAG: TonB-dependent receptor [Pseudomonadota bacterium]